MSGGWGGRFDGIVLQGVLLILVGWKRRSWVRGRDGMRTRMRMWEVERERVLVSE